jgi:tRNA threonylcarbamoyladenosine biosynthesis protein TsaB
MRIIGLDSATNVASVAIVDENRLLAELTFNTKKNHSQRLMPMLAWMLDEVQLSLDDISGFAVAVGPGSFTGLRIGLATMKGLAHVKDKPILAIPTLDGLAANLEGVQGIICPILNARRNEVYTALYRWNSGHCRRLTDYMALGLEKLARLLEEADEEVTFLGDGVPAYQESLKTLLPHAHYASHGNAICRGAQIARLGLEKLKQGEIADYYSLEPLYIRESEAEVKWREKQQHGKEM